MRSTQTKNSNTRRQIRINTSSHRKKVVHFTRRSAMEQQLNRIQLQLYHIQEQLTRIARLLNDIINNNNNNNNRLPDQQQQRLDELAERRREALERHRIEWERCGRHTPVRRRPSEEGEDEID